MSINFLINPTSIKLSYPSVKGETVFIYRNRIPLYKYYLCSVYTIDLSNKFIAIMKVKNNTHDFTYDNSYYVKKFFIDNEYHKKNFHAIKKNNKKKFRHIIKILHEYKIYLFTYFIYNKYYNTYSNTKIYTIDNLDFIHTINEKKLFNCLDFYKIYSFI